MIKNFIPKNNPTPIKIAKIPSIKGNNPIIKKIDAKINKTSRRVKFNQNNLRIFIKKCILDSEP